MPNKIKYGLKSVYYAVGTPGANNTMTYGTPVAIPGAVNLSLDPQGDSTPFYADNIVYYQGTANTGYEGDLEIALIPDSFKTDVLGFITDGKDVLVEDAEAATVHFALLFQFEGDSKATKHVLYNCTAARPTVAGATKEASIEPQTETLSITATTVYFATVDTEVVKAEANEDSDSTTYSGWTTTVYTPIAPST
ncbi:MAG: phage tail protein [Oscillospiraceae bacterium]|nr:phage tail protein [Oscillospiraceae bacterium]MBR3239846.1 phage tail protein [Oscillospiraceae bacterium]